MAIGTPVAGAIASSAANGTSVAPSYPSGIVSTDQIVLFVGQKPSTANSGTITPPSGWTLRDELLAAGGYGTTLGNDTGNTNLKAYTKDTVTGTETGTVSVTLATNSVSWACIIRIPTGGNSISYGSADGQRTTAPTSPMSITLTNGSTATNFQSGDLALWAMCIPTDVQTPSQFSAQAISVTGVTFGTAAELGEADSTAGFQIGGYLAWAKANSGSGTSAPAVTTTLTGTLTNVRGPVVLLRVRQDPHSTSGTMVGQIGAVSGSASRQSSSVSHATSGTLSASGSSVSGLSARSRSHASSGAISTQSASIVGSSARSSLHSSTGTLTGQGSDITGIANRIREHDSSGDLIGPKSILLGTSVSSRFAFALKTGKSFAGPFAK